MKLSELTSTLETVLGEIGAADLAERDLRVLFNAKRDDGTLENPALRRLVSTLEAESSLRFFDRGHLVVAGVIVCWDYDMLAEWLIERARAANVIQAIEDLGRFLGTDVVPYESGVALGGIAPAGADGLVEGVDLRSWSDVLRAPLVQRLVEILEPLGDAHRPTAALLVRGEEPLDDRSWNESKLLVADLDTTPLQDLVLLMALTGPTPVHPIGYWLEVPEWVPLVGDSHYTFDPTEGRGAIREWPQEGPDRTRELHECWQARSEEERKRLRIAMQRLVTAMRRKSQTDSAIDLGIAIEALLSPEDGPGIGRRLRTRGPSLLSSDTKEQAQYTTLMDHVWKLRCSAVHTGWVERLGPGVNTGEILNRGFRAAAGMASKIIREGTPRRENEAEN